MIWAVAAIVDVAVPARPLSMLRGVIGEERFRQLEAAASRTRSMLGGRIVWNVSSTASGGGVAEMLQVLVGYSHAEGIDIRWVVIQGDAAFFEITKRLHNRIHGVQGDTGSLGRSEAAHYAEVNTGNATALLQQVRPGDVVILHDPQTAGMAALLGRAGVAVVWRCHIGADTQNGWTAEAWAFLEPLVAGCDAFVFSRRSYGPPWVPAERLWVIPPSIDPFSPKNQPLPDGAIPPFLAHIGLLSGPTNGAAGFTRRDGSRGHVVHRASVVSEGPWDEPGQLVVQVSRWDRLKDMRGVMDGFVSGVLSGPGKAGSTASSSGRGGAAYPVSTTTTTGNAATTATTTGTGAGGDARLLLVGPSVEGVTDDPEGAEVLADCTAAWEALPARIRRSIALVTLPMTDVDENAAMVNALQRAATVIVQKSLAEGFGLTVAEGMWKAKPVVASAVGGIIDQVAPGTGILLDDPTDLDAFGEAVSGLLRDPAEVVLLGERARRRVIDMFVGDRHLLQYGDLLARLVPGR